MSISAEVVTVTPTMAALWLSHNPNNRPISKAKVGQFASDMTNGRWVLNGEPIIFSDDGLLNDGQHRLLACISAQQAFATTIISGVARASRTTVDQGRNRGAADYLQMGGATYAKAKATVGRLILAFEKSGGRHLGGRTNVTNAEIMERVADDERLEQCIRETHGGHVARRSPLSGTIGAFVRYITPDADAPFFDQVAFGEHIGRGDPSFAVRERLAVIGRCGLSEKVETYLRGLRAYQQKRRLTRICLTGSFPQ